MQKQPTSNIDEIAQKQPTTDIDEIVDNLKNAPQTYNTMIGNFESNNTTMHTILRRKLNNLCRDGSVLKMSIPGTRSGQILFYVMSKQYYILVEDIHIGSRTYYFNEYERSGPKKIKVKKCWALKRDAWEEHSGREFSELDVLFFI